MRPGPERIEPGGAPGGLVLHTYSLEGELIRASAFGPGLVDPEFAAVIDATAVLADPRADAGVVLVVFDGDTGDRWGPADFVAAAFP